MVGSAGAPLAAILLILLLASPVGGACRHEDDKQLVVRGEVALTDAPFCAFFVVATSRGLSLLTLRRGREVFAEGDRVLGPLHSPGRQFITLPDWQNDTLEVDTEEVSVSLDRAQTAFRARCAAPERPVVLGAVPSISDGGAR